MCARDWSWQGRECAERLANGMDGNREKNKFSFRFMAAQLKSENTCKGRIVCVLRLLSIFVIDQVENRVSGDRRHNHHITYHFI